MAADALLKSLSSNKKLFYEKIPDGLRKWFTRKLLNYVRYSHITDEQIMAISLLEKAKARAKQCVEALRTKTKQNVYLLDANDKLSIITYGTMGIFPEVFLLDKEEAAFLQFIVHRRSSTVNRMCFDVNNPSIFVYPDGGPETYHTNLLSKPYWDGVLQLPDKPKKSYPFILSLKGLEKPYNYAFKNLFEGPAEDDNEKSGFDCASAAMIVQTTALLEAAANPDDFGKKLAGEGWGYVTIDHPYGSSTLVNNTIVQNTLPIVIEPTGVGALLEVKVAFAWTCPTTPFYARLLDADHEQIINVVDVGKTTTGYTGKVTIESLDYSFKIGARLVPAGLPEYHLITDRRADVAMFEQVFVPEDELQIGDHIYVANHPLHRYYLYKVSVWGGEHSFVFDAPFRNRDQLRLTGHGFSNTTFKDMLDNKMMGETNQFLARLRRLLEQQLKNPLPYNKIPFDQIKNNNGLKADLQSYLEVQLQKGKGDLSTAIVMGNCYLYRFIGDETKLDDGSIENQTWETLTFEGKIGDIALDQKSIIFCRTFSDSVEPQNWSKNIGYVTIELNVALASDLTLPEAARYGISYDDDVFGIEGVFFPLYYTEGKRRGGFRPITYDDIRDISILCGMDGKLFVTRPRIERDPSRLAAYIAILQKKGALPSSV